MSPTQCVLVSLLALLSPSILPAQEKAAQNTPEPASSVAAPTEQQRKQFIEELLKSADMKPLVFPAGSLRRIEYNARLAKWAERKLVPALNAETAKLTLDEKQRAEITNIPAFWTRSKSPGDWTRPAKVLDDVLGSQTEVPVLRFFVSQAEYDAGRAPAAFKNLAFVLKEANRDTPPILVALAASHLLRQKDLDQLRVREYQTKFCESLLAALQDGSFDGEDAFALPDLLFDLRYDRMVEDHPRSVIEVLEKSTLAEWARLAILGRCETRIGWEERGSGFADAVTPEGWEGFAKHLELASKALQRSWKLNPKELWAAHHMITVTMAEHGDEKVSLREWFDRVTAVVCDFMPSYEYMRNALHPKWSGSNTALLAFGLACAQTHRDDTEITFFLAEVLETLSEYARDWQPMYGQPVIAAELLDSYRRRIALFGEPVGRYYYSDLAVYGCLAGDWGTAGKAAAKLVSSDEAHRFLLHKPQRQLMANLGMDEQTALLEAELRSGPFGNAFINADDLRIAGKYEEAKTAWHELLLATKDTLPVRLKSFVSARAALSQFEATYEKGKWVRYPLLADVWRNPFGRMMEGNTDLHFVSTASLHSAFLGRLGPRYEMRGKVVFKGAEAGSMIAHCGLMLGCSPLGTGKYAREWITLTMDAVDEKTANFGFQARYHKPLPIPPKQAALQAENTFLFRRDKDRVTFEFNGEKIYDAVGIPPNLPSGEGATGFQFEAIPGQEIIVSEMEARLLGTDS